MEKYLALILLTAPGFMARRVARCLGDKPSKRGEFESALIYFAYSLGALFITLFIAWFLGMFSAFEPWSALEAKISLPWFAAQFMFLSIVSSIATGVIWCVWLEKWLMQFFNAINRFRNVNEVYLEGLMLHKLFDDNEDHFLVIEKDGKRLAAGLFRGISSPTSERTEMALACYPEYNEWINNPDNEKSKVKAVYFDLTSSVVIREFDFPEEWITLSVSEETVDVEA